jgi:hypothetical protein
MAASFKIPTKLKKSQANGSEVIDFDTDTIKAMIVQAGSGMPDTSKTGVQYVSDVTAANTEVTGTGYARQAITGSTVAFDATGTTIVDWSFGDITFAQNAAGFANGAYIILYKDKGGADSANPVIGVGDPNQTLDVTGGDLVIKCPAGGLIQWQ